MKNDTVIDADKRAALSAFIWWSAWSAVTQRPGKDVSYTNNWPHDELVGNQPPGQLLMWTVFSVLFLIAGIALLAWHHARHREEPPPQLPESDPLAMVRVTPSMRATAKYFWLVMALFLTQILPYSLARTWHTQRGVLWFATAWLGAGLFIAPAVSRREPALQGHGSHRYRPRRRRRDARPDPRIHRELAPERLARQSRGPIAFRRPRGRP